MEKEIEKLKNKIKELQIEASRIFGAAEKTILVCNSLDESWSGSDLVGHADLFYGDFEKPPYHSRFSVEWGLIHGIPDGWQERSAEVVRKKIENDAEVSLEDLDKKAEFLADEFEELRRQTIITFASVSTDLSKEIEKFNFKTKIDIFNQYWKRQIMTRDSNALYSGRQVPGHKYYLASALFITSFIKQLKEFLHIIDKTVSHVKNFEQENKEANRGRTTYIDKNTLLRLKKIQNKNFDLSKLILLCAELDDNYSLEHYNSSAMLLRAIVDHIPPIFGKVNFEDVCSQYGSKSFKDIVRPLNETAKKIADVYLHSQISKKVLATTKTQVDFQANLDTLLNEAAAILEKSV